MAAQDDEMEALKGAVLQTLENKGTLRTIRAQLRASVFEAVKEGAGPESAPLPEPAGGSSEQASLLRDLMHEYMAFYGLEYSRDVFACEAGCARAQVPGRSQLRAAVGLAPRSDAAAGGAPAPLPCVVQGSSGRGREQLRPGQQSAWRTAWAAWARRSGAHAGLCYLLSPVCCAEPGLTAAAWPG